MKGVTKKELKEYDKRVKEKAKKFKLKSEDFHNLYDLFWMINAPETDLVKTLKSETLCILGVSEPEISENLHEISVLNKMDKWFYEFHARVERVLFDEDFSLDLKNEIDISK